MPCHAAWVSITPAPRPGKLAACALALGLAGCGLPALPRCAALPDRPLVWVADFGWHTEVAILVADLSGPLAGLAARFPGAAALSFGFGQRRFVLAEAGDPLRWLLGPLPGEAVVQVTGLGAPPPLALGRPVARLPLPPGGRAPLSGFVWDSLAKDAGGAPVLALDRPLRGRLFFRARRGYSLGYTCNTWAAEALRHAGFGVRDGGVVLAGGVLGQLAALRGACGG